VTTLINNLPPDKRSKVAAILAATATEVNPGRIATKKRIWRVRGSKEDATIQASSQERPVGSNAPA
jgi:hypothetical protein